MMEHDDFFDDHPESRQLFDVLRDRIARLGPVELRVSKSQVAFCRGKPFAFAWMPAKYLNGSRRLAPLVLSVSLHRRDHSPRWKEIVEPYPGRFTHHLELFGPEDVDAEVTGWLRAAWDAAGL